MSVCEICGTKEKLVEHHTSYEPEVLQTLCGGCHRKVHLSGEAPSIPEKFWSKRWHKKRKTIKIAENVHKDLMSFKFKIGAQVGKDVTLGDAIAYLLELI